MNAVRARAERAGTALGFGLVSGLAGVALGAATGGAGWAFVVGGTTAAAGAQFGRLRPDRSTRRTARLTRATAEDLAPLRRDGWHLLHARPLGQAPERAYHLCVPPCAATVMVLMDWAWPCDGHIHLDEDEALCSGTMAGDPAVDDVLHGSQAVRDALAGHRKALGRIGVGQVLPVHEAPVAGDGHLQFHRDHAGQEREINVVHNSVLLKKMRTVPGRAPRTSHRVARNVARLLDNVFP